MADEIKIIMNVEDEDETLTSLLYSDFTRDETNAQTVSLIKSYEMSPVKRKRTVIRGISDETSSPIDRSDKYSKSFKFKKAIDGDIDYFKYWRDKFNNSKDQRERKEVLDEFSKTESKSIHLTVLHYAAQYCRNDICDILLKTFKCDINVQNSKGITPLHLLVKRNNKFKEVFCDEKASEELCGSSRPNSVSVQTTLEYLIENNADVNIQDENGFTALHYAAMKDNIFAARTLLKIANFEITDNQNMSPLHIVCKYGSDEVFKLLLDKFDYSYYATYTDTKSSLPVHLACACKVEKLEMIQQMLDLLSKYDKSHKDSRLLETVLSRKNSKNRTALHICIENNHFNLVKLLCEKYKTSTKEAGGSIENAPIHMAAKIGSIEIMNVLCASGADLYALNGRNENLLHVAAAANKSEFISGFLHNEKQKRLLVRRSINYIPCVHITNLRQYTPLLSAVVADNTVCVDVLLKSGKANIEDKDLDDNTVFHLCSLYNNLSTFNYLLESSYFTDQSLLAILKQSDRYDNTFLHIACKYGYTEIILLVYEKLKLAMNEIVFAKNNDDQTGFHIACARGNFDIVKFFLEKFNSYALMQDIDEEFNTGLHLACIKGHYKIVRLLIRYNAPVLVRNENDYYPLDISCIYGWDKIVELLIENYAYINYSGDFDFTPLLLSCENGKNETVKLLLKNGADLLAMNRKKENCLDLALKNNHSIVVETLLSQPNWSQLIHAESTQQPHQYKHFIECMPDMMNIILDKIEERERNEKKGNFNFKEIDFDFNHIDEHPLMIMAESNRESLLKHPTTQKLIELKWKRFPQTVYVINLFFYIIFLILLTLHVRASNKQFHYHNRNLTNGSQERILVLHHHEISTLDQGLVWYFLTIILLVIHVFKEIFQMVNNGWEHFKSLDNLIELATYTLSVIFLVPMPDYFCKSDNSHDTEIVSANNRITFHRCHIQWELGSIAILLSWVVLVFFIEKLRIFGKYVVMFHKILINSFQFFVLFFTLLFGFSLSFSMLFRARNKDFNQMSTAIMKTLSMMIGEVDFNETFTEKSWIDYIVYVLFVIIMCIIVLNLLVGLAVGDISKVEKDAYVELMSMKIKFILKTQKSFRDKPYFKRNFMTFDGTNADTTFLHRVLHVFSRLFSCLVKEDLNYGTQSNDPFKNCSDIIKSNSNNRINKLNTEFQSKMLTNFETLAESMVKLNQEIKYLKVQVKGLKKTRKTEINS